MPTIDVSTKYPRTGTVKIDEKAEAAVGRGRMVERVAAAVWEHNRDAGSYERASDGEKAIARLFARDIIKAMREPTQAMINAPEGNTLIAPKD